MGLHYFSESKRQVTVHAWFQAIIGIINISLHSMTTLKKVIPSSTYSLHQTSHMARQVLRPASLAISFKNCETRPFVH